MTEFKTGDIYYDNGGNKLRIIGTLDNKVYHLREGDTVFIRLLKETIGWTKQLLLKDCPGGTWFKLVNPYSDYTQEEFIKVDPNHFVIQTNTGNPPAYILVVSKKGKLFQLSGNFEVKVTQ